MRTAFFLSILVVVALCYRGANAAYYCYNNGMANQVSEPSAFQNCDAFGSYDKTQNVTGWNMLKLTTNGSVEDSQQAYALGFLEGYASATDIVTFHHNTLGPAGAFAVVNPKINEWIKSNYDWMKNESSRLHGGSRSDAAQWQFVSLMVQQVEGIYAGIVAAGYSNWPMENLLISMSMTDVVSDLEPYLGNSNVSLPVLERLHCSALVKVNDDLSDIFFGHATWMNYNTMLRVFKTITLNYNSVDIAARTVQFSSYPGDIAITDDFYALSSGMAVFETSFSIYNMSIYDTLTPKSLLSSFRSTLANRLANNGEEWGSLLSFHNSGTYNNQWVVLDMKRFEPRKGLRSGTLQVVEQVGQYIESHDQTFTLSLGYWPSFNVPASKKLYDIAGYQGHGVAFDSYENSVRARLFRELQSTVETMADFQYLMQYNDYQTNTLEEGNPVYAIAARADLAPPKQAMGFGAIDCKTLSYNDFYVSNTSSVFAFSGPTPQQEVFSFATSTAPGLTPHIGLPTTFNFTWQTFNP